MRNVSHYVTENMTLSKKPEVRNVLRYLPKRTEPVTRTCTENFVSFVHGFFEVQERTGRHADTLIAILRSHAGRSNKWSEKECECFLSTKLGKSIDFYHTCIARQYCSDSNSRPVSTQLRWDKADRASYCYYTGLHLDPLLGVVDDMMKARQAGTAVVDDVHKCIESVYSSVVSILNSAARLYVPECPRMS